MTPDTHTLTNLIAAWDPSKLIQACVSAGIDTRDKDTHTLAEELVRAIDESITRTRWMQ